MDGVPGSPREIQIGRPPAVTDPLPRHLSPPPGYALRRPSLVDAEAVTALKRSVDVDRYGGSEATADDVRDEWALPGLSLDVDVPVVDDAGGSVVAYGLCSGEARVR